MNGEGQKYIQVKIDRERVKMAKRIQLALVTFKVVLLL